jgi:cardiolipin synthase
MPSVAELFEHPHGTSLGEVEVDRLLTVPNLITTIRLLCVPLFLYLLFGRDSHGWAAFLLGTLGATDWVDGYIARRFNQSSTFGKMYDPTVDRFMLVVAIVAIIVADSVPLWYAIVVLVREVLVSMWVVYITARGAKRMNVTWWGKVGTFANMCAFPWFLFAHEQSWTTGWRDFWTVMAWCAAVPGLIFSLFAAWQYVSLGRRALAEGRDAAAAESTPGT